MNYVIIGNSTAAVGAVEGIRQQDKEGTITILSSEPYHTYSRPLISYLLYGKTTEEKMKYRPSSFYEDNNCRFIHATAEKLDIKNKTILLESGESIPYDKLLLATGSRPFVPPMEGLDTVEKKFTFMSLDDAKAVGAAITPQSRVLIVGAGLIGLKAAEGILHSVASITVIDLADRILPSILDSEGSAIVEQHLAHKGLHFLLGDSVSSFSGGSALLKSGKTISFDILIIAVGVRPNIQLLKDAGGAVQRGICTDLYCRTSIPDIYAAGDCAESYDTSIGENRVLALLPNAYMQGHCAGTNMAGGTLEFNTAIPMNAIGFFGLHVITAGSYDGEIILSKNDTNYKKMIMRDGRLVGYIMIGEVQRAGIYTSLIRDQISLDTVDLDLLIEKPQLLAFSKAVRKDKLGGAENAN